MKNKKTRKIFNEIGRLLDQYINVEDWKIKENSNMTYSLQGLNNYISTSITSHYWLNKIYPKNIRSAYGNNEIHIHDLGLLSPYCCGWNLEELLNNGFRGVPSKTESKPPKHFKTALGQIVNFFYTLQGEAAGAQAFSNFDTLLAPYIHYDKLDYSQVKQGVQEFIYNMNIPTRVGFQTPFTNVTMDLTPTGSLADSYASIGGNLCNKKYKEFQIEIDMLNQAFLEVMIEGDAKGRIFTFPIPTYNVTKEFDWDRPIVDLIMDATARYGTPYFANFVNSDMNSDDARSMCCRLRLDNRELAKRGGGLFGANPLTGSIGVVTLNLPRAAYFSSDKNDFLKRVEKLLNISKESLEIKRDILERYTEKNLYPYTKHYLSGVKHRNGHYWFNHFSTIGVVGMHEACLNLFKKGIESEEGTALAAETLELIRNKLKKFQDETGHLFNLEATPAEGTAYRLAKNDLETLDNIIVSGENEPFYTNSTQLPVDYSTDIFEVLEHQDRIQPLYTGGTVVHLFVGEKIPGGEICKKLVQKITSNYHLPYFTISPTFSICPNHGYFSGEHFACPKGCDLDMEVYSRVVGYYRPIKDWNKGKREEYSHRKTFKIKS